MKVLEHTNNISRRAIVSDLRWRVGDDEGGEEGEDQEDEQEDDLSGGVVYT